MPPHPELSPSFTVRVAEAVPHIDTKHVQDRYERPLWLEFISSHGDLVRGLEQAIQRSLQRPLFVEYDQFDSDGVFLHKTRECVTREGLIAVIRLTDGVSGDLITAFFPYETFDARRQRRWMAACESRINVYGSRVTFGLAQTYLAPPTPEDVFPSDDPLGERRNVHFVDHLPWGIRKIQVAGTDCLAFCKPPGWPAN